LGKTKALEGVKIWEDPLTGRRLTQVRYSALGPEVVERILKKAQSYTGGVNDPIFQADYELNLKAQPGDMIFKSFGTHNIQSVVPDKQYPQILSADFAYAPDYTCIHASQVTETQIQVYYEHFLNQSSARVHKQRLRMGLVQFDIWSEYASGEKALKNVFERFDACGDVTATGYKGEYIEDPWPIVFQPPSTDPDWRDREGSEGILDGLLRELKRCCNLVWPDEQEKCDKCKKKLEKKAGIVFDPNCNQVIDQIPAQVIDENGKRNKHISDDAVDSVLYLCRFAMRVAVIKAEEPKTKPWWLPKPQPKGIDDEDLKAYGGNAAVARFFK